MPRLPPDPPKLPTTAELSECSKDWQARLGVGPRRAEVAHLLTLGFLSDKELAEALSISVSRAHEHVQALMRLLGVNSRGRLVIRLLEANERVTPLRIEGVPPDGSPIIAG